MTNSDNVPVSKSVQASKVQPFVIPLKRKTSSSLAEKKPLKKKPLKNIDKNFMSSQDKILQDLDEMYEAAFAGQNFAIALRALELRGKHLGLFGDKKMNQLKSLDQMTEDELRALLG